MTFVDYIYDCEVVGVNEDGLAGPFVAPKDGGGYYGVDFKDSGRSNLALVCQLQGPFCCEPFSIIEPPKTSRRGGIGVKMDVVRMRQLVVVEEGYPVPVGKEVEPQTKFGPA